MSGCEGFRVLRGPDWAGQDTDGGEGFLGTVTQSHGNQTVRVQWDMGQESTCCAGKDGKLELRIYDTAQAGICHPGMTCAECGEHKIYGTLWRCQDCVGCDLCPLCYSGDKHDLRHRFLRVDAPDCEGQPVPKRKTSVRVRAIGIFPGSKVVRGKDWEWGNQDGGLGSEGEVTDFEASPSVTRRSLVKVKWPQGLVNSYRLGFRGKVDIKCVEEDVGPFYYRDHLLVLDTTRIPKAAISESSVNAGVATSRTPQQPAAVDGHGPAAGNSSPRGMTNSGAEAARADVGGAGKTDQEEKLRLTAGDKVVIRVGEDRLKELQQTWGGCTARMLRCIGRTGEVTGTAKNGAVCVRFGDTKFNYRFNPQVLLKVAKVFTANDMVRIRDDLDLLKRLNSKVGWKSAMDKTVGRVGRVARVDDDGDLRVDFNGNQYAYSPACCLPVAAGIGVDTLDSSAPSSGADGRVGVEVSGKTNSDNQSQESTNMAMFRKIRETFKSQSGQGQSQGNGQSMRALFTAIEYEQVDKVRDICQQDPSMVDREYQEITALIYASLRGRVGSAVALLDLGADVNRASSKDDKKTPMSAVIEGKSEDVAEVLLTRGANMRQLYGDGHTLAHYAVIKDKRVCLSALIKHGADLNAQDDDGDTPLHLAIKIPRHQVMEMLVDLPQVNIHLSDNKGLNMIQLCAFTDNPRALQRLVSRDCSGIESLRQGHSTALHIAATNDHVECIRLLIMDGGAKINAQQVTSKQTALHIASHRAKVSSVEALLELGAEVNLRDKDGDTPLHMAIGGKVEGFREVISVETVVACRIQIANMLITHGAFVDAANLRGRHPFSYGVSSVRNGVMAFLRHNKGVVCRESRHGDVDHFLASIGVLNALSSSQSEHAPLREALKGVELPCGLCGRSQSDVTLHPCEHKCLCNACCLKVNKCPLCDEKITKRMHVV